jgi:hypothetical protein
VRDPALTVTLLAAAVVVSVIVVRGVGRRVRWLRGRKR